LKAGTLEIRECALKADGEYQREMRDLEEVIAWEGQELGQEHELRLVLFRKYDPCL
jgi:hypothetical protein